MSSSKSEDYAFKDCFLVLSYTLTNELILRMISIRLLVCQSKQISKPDMKRWIMESVLCVCGEGGGGSGRGRGKGGSESKRERKRR